MILGSGPCRSSAIGRKNQTCEHDIPAILQHVVPKLHKFLVLAVREKDGRAAGHQIFQPARVSQTRNMEQVPEQPMSLPRHQGRKLMIISGCRQLLECRPHTVHPMVQTGCTILGRHVWHLYAVLSLDSWSFAKGFSIESKC